MTTKEEVVKEALAELDRAIQKFPSFRSFHEGYGIIKEELDELWEEIKSHDKKEDWNKESIYKEALHLSAMSIRFLIDFQHMLEASIEGVKRK